MDHQSQHLLGFGLEFFDLRLCCAGRFLSSWPYSLGLVSGDIGAAARFFKQISRMAKSGTLMAVWAALAGNVLVAAAKFVAAAVTGSAAMLSEAVHSLVDTVNELLLLYGIARSSGPRTACTPSATPGSSISGASWWHC